MAQFPALRSGAVMQYGSGQGTQWRTEVLRFLDGREQTYRLMAKPLRRWLVQAELLDEAELAQLQAFYEQMQGGAGQFAFTDPNDQQTYPNCSFDVTSGQTALTLQWHGEQRGRFEIVIRENRV